MMHKMMKLWVILPAVAFVGLLGVAVLDETGAPAPGDAAPVFVGLLLDGGSLSSEDLKGKPVVLNFWASWCGPCEDEAPLLDAAHEEFGERVAFVGINIRDARSDAASFADRYDLDYPHVRDESLAIYDEFGLTGQPETFFIDQEGVVVEHVRGPLLEEGLYRMLDVLVARDA